MAFRRRVRPIRTRAETLRWGKRQGLGESSHSFRPCGAARARPYRDRGQAKPETALTEYTACEANHVGPLPVLFCRDLSETRQRVPVDGASSSSRRSVSSHAPSIDAILG